MNPSPDQIVREAADLTPDKIASYTATMEIVKIAQIDGSKPTGEYLSSLVWASWLQSVSPKAKAEIEQAVKQIETELSILQSENQRLQGEVEGLKKQNSEMREIIDRNLGEIGMPTPSEQREEKI